MISPFEDEGDQLGKGHNFPWVHALPMFDYIVINTGPHWHPNLKWGPNQSESELKEAFKRSMRIVFDYLKTHVQPHQRVWIRSTPYGHANCAQFTSPQAVPFVPTGQTGEYEWHMFELFDGIWKAKNDDRFAFLDVALSNLRGDSHSRPGRDCLHTCLPGPVDDWNRLIHHEITRQLSNERL
ncbi:hypothetical protein DFQ29_009271 [Apophysomyces sp. BC1021]|nr:hypothetical protein DFQ29_009271 [Apophysomyces sp. BC1021]